MFLPYYLHLLMVVFPLVLLINQVLLQFQALVLKNQPSNLNYPSTLGCTLQPLGAGGVTSVVQSTDISGLRDVP